MFDKAEPITFNLPVVKAYMPGSYIKIRETSKKVQVLSVRICGKKLSLQYEVVAWDGLVRYETWLQESEVEPWEEASESLVILPHE